MDRRPRFRGFTLLEVMIAMSILAIGATSILSIFIAAIAFQSDRVEQNREMDLYNFAREHAVILWNNFDPTQLKEGQSPFPAPLTADLRGSGWREHADSRVREAGRRFAGYKYRLTFEGNPFDAGGTSVAVNVEVWGLQDEEDKADSRFSGREILTRTGTPVHEFWKSPSLEDARKRREQTRREGR